MNADMVLRQIQEGQAPKGGALFRPRPYPLLFLIFHGLIYAILAPLGCTLGYGLLYIILGREATIASGPWPIYTTYPFLAIPPLLIPFLLPYLVWYLERRDRDTILVLFPEGFIQYRAWSDERKRQTKVIEYRQIEKIMPRYSRANNRLEIDYTDGKQERIFITGKYDVPDAIAQQIVSDYHHFMKQS